MNDYVLVDSATGKCLQIIRGLVSPPNAVDAPSGHEYLAVVPGFDATGVFLDIVTKAFVTKGASPSVHHAFDYTTKTWVDSRTMQSRIDKTVAAIKAERDKRKSGGTLINGKWYHSDEPSRLQQLGLVMMGADVPVVQWKTMDGSFVAMTQALANAIFTATATLDMALFANAEAHIAAVATCADPDLYNYSIGWPAHFIG